MKKLSKKIRFELILKILSDAKKSLSITEIHEVLTRVHTCNLSRKTIHRDLQEMLIKGSIRSSVDLPFLSFYACPPSEFHLELTNEEATYLIIVLPEDHKVNQRLRKMMGI